MPVALLSACGPKMNAYADKIAGRLVTVENTDNSAFTITRIVANASRDNSSCNDYPNKRLAPGEAYSTTFVMCGPTHKLTIETDRGTSSLTL